ncbi:MAG: glutamine--tRNA ligase, partial [Desulfobacterales bacterium]
MLNPLRVVIENFPEGKTEEVTAVNNPEDSTMGTRALPFSKVLYIEQDDFMEDPPKKYFRLAPGREVRLRYAYFITCTDVIKDDTGRVIELRCTYDPETRGGDAPDGRKVKATLHWVSADHAVDAEVRLYENLFTIENPGAAEDFKSALNENSVQVLQGCKLEPGLGAVDPGSRCQFERLGYFSADIKDFTPDHPVFNRIVTLRDMWAKIKK